MQERREMRETRNFPRWLISQIPRYRYFLLLPGTCFMTPNLMQQNLWFFFSFNRTARLSNLNSDCLVYSIHLEDFLWLHIRLVSGVYGTQSRLFL